MATEDKIRQGLSFTEARRQARVELGKRRGLRVQPIEELREA